MAATQYKPIVLKPYMTKKLLPNGTCEVWDEVRWTESVENLCYYFVVDLASDEYLVSIQRQIDTVWGPEGKRCLHFACGSDKADGHRLSLLKGLLHLGADPDVLDSTGFTASYRCSEKGFAAYAEVIARCRPNVDLYQGSAGEKGNFFTPLLRAMHGAVYHGTIQRGCDPGMAEVADVWRKVAANRCPSLAELAHDKDWWAVHNLCRRRIVSEAEKTQTFMGKSALEWAKFHGETKVADELVYLFELEADDESTQPTRQHQNDSKLIATLPAQTSLKAGQEDLSKKVAELENENQALKKKLSQLRSVLMAVE